MRTGQAGMTSSSCVTAPAMGGSCRGQPLRRLAAAGLELLQRRLPHPLDADAAIELRVDLPVGHAGEPGDQALLGVVTLEIFGFMINPFLGEIQPMRTLLMSVR